MTSWLWLLPAVVLLAGLLSPTGGPVSFGRTVPASWISLPGEVVSSSLAGLGFTDGRQKLSLQWCSSANGPAAERAQ